MHMQMQMQMSTQTQKQMQGRVLLLLIVAVLLPTHHVQAQSCSPDTTPPTLDGSFGTSTIPCNLPLPAPQLIPSDNCPGVTVQFAVSEQRSNASYATVRRQFQAVDAAGNTAGAIQIIQIVPRTCTSPLKNDDLTCTCVAAQCAPDIIAPVLSGVPSDVVVTCDSIPPAPAVTATDNCDTVTAQFTQQRINGVDASTYQLIRRWTAADHYSNAVTAQAVVNVVHRDCGSLPFDATTCTCVDPCNPDTSPPIFSGVPPASIDATCDSIPPPPALFAADDCGTVYVEFNEELVPGIDASTYTIIRSWTATDGAGLSVSLVSQVHVQHRDCGALTLDPETCTCVDSCALDTQPPQFESVPQDVSIACNAGYVVPDVAASDNCPGVSVSYAAEQQNVVSASSYELVETWTATDAAGNSLSHVRRLTIVPPPCTAPQVPAVSGACACGCPATLQCLNGGSFSSSSCSCSCPAGKTYNAGTDTCDCNSHLNCANGGTFNSATCSCSCPPGKSYQSATDSCVCSTALLCTGGTFSSSSCSCSCPAPRVFNAVSDACVCPTTLTCANGGTFNPATCSCSCPAGKTYNAGTDTCDCVSASCTAPKTFQNPASCGCECPAQPCDRLLDGSCYCSTCGDGIVQLAYESCDSGAGCDSNCRPVSGFACTLTTVAGNLVSSCVAADLQAGVPVPSSLSDRSLLSVTSSTNTPTTFDFPPGVAGTGAVIVKEVSAAEASAASPLPAGVTPGSIFLELNNNDQGASLDFSQGPARISLVLPEASCSPATHLYLLIEDDPDFTPGWHFARDTCSGADFHETFDSATCQLDTNICHATLYAAGVCSKQCEAPQSQLNTQDCACECPSCPEGAHLVSPETCSCACDQTCTFPFMRGLDTCDCVCTDAPCTAPNTVRNPGTCECECACLACAPGLVPVDTNNDDCADACECEAGAHQVCDAGYALDTQSDECPPPCVCSPASLSCSAGQNAVDTNDDQCADSCECKPAPECEDGTVAEDLLYHDGCPDTCVGDEEPVLVTFSCDPSDPAGRCQQAVASSGAGTRVTIVWGSGGSNC